MEQHDAGRLQRYGAGLGESANPAGVTGWAFGDLMLDEGGHRLMKQGQSRHLPLKEFRLLQLLVHAQGTIVGRNTLMDALWPDDNVSDAALAKTVQKLRCRLDDAGDQIIRTIYKVGYQLVPRARRLGLAVPIAGERKSAPRDFQEDLRPIGNALHRLVSQFDLLPLSALRAAIEIAAVCHRVGQVAETRPVFAAAAARLRVTHGEQFALTQLAEFYLADCLAQLGEDQSLSAEQLKLLRPEALAHAEPGAGWDLRLSQLKARLGDPPLSCAGN